MLIIVTECYCHNEHHRRAERETDESWDDDECRSGIDRVKNNINFHAFSEG